MLAGLTESIGLRRQQGQRASERRRPGCNAGRHFGCEGERASRNVRLVRRRSGKPLFRGSRRASSRRRIHVRVLRDAVGGARGSEQALRSLCESGVHMAEYCAPRWWNIGRFNSRTHRKLLVIDGRIAYTFGHGISDRVARRRRRSEHWRDTALRLEGPHRAWTADRLRAELGGRDEHLADRRKFLSAHRGGRKDSCARRQQRLRRRRLVRAMLYTVADSLRAQRGADSKSVLRAESRRGRTVCHAHPPRRASAPHGAGPAIRTALSCGVPDVISTVDCSRRASASMSTSAR